MSDRGNYEDRHTPDTGVRRCQPGMAKVPCPHCGKMLRGEPGVHTHIIAKHGGKGRGKFQREDSEESFADRAVQAEIDIACGFKTDDDWLLP